MDESDAIVVGAGLAGLVAACELIEAGKTVSIVDQEGEQSLGGQAFWSLGGIFLVDSPEQRRMRIHDSTALALEDWMGTAAFDRAEDEWPRKWAEAYVAFAAGEKRAWLHERGVRFFPLVGWAERGGHNAIGHGNSVPRFHIAWGTGPGIVAPFVGRVREAAKRPSRPRGSSCSPECTATCQPTARPRLSETDDRQRIEELRDASPSAPRRC